MIDEPDGGVTPALRDVDLGALPALFDTVLDQSGTGVMVFDAELRIAYVNEVAARVGGYPVDVHIGRRLEDLHPEIAEQARPGMVEALESRVPVRNRELVWESSRPPHERRFWMVTFVPLQDQHGEPHVAAIYVETTAARRAHERLARLLDALPTFVGTCTPDGLITDANAATLAAADLGRDELIGRPLWEASFWGDDPAVRRRIHDAVVQAQEGRATRFDVHIGGETTAAVDFSLVPIVEHGAVTALVPSALDITERVAEAARLQSLADLSRALNSAVTTDEATDHVVALAPEIVGARVASVALVDRAERVMRIVHGLPPEIAERWTTLSLSGPRTVWHDAIESGRTLVVDRPTRAQRYPEAVADARLAGLDTTAAVPLRDENGDVFGAIGIGWASPLDDVHRTRLRLQLLGDLCSDALRRAQRTDAEHRFVRELQAEVLAEPDAPAGLEVAFAYEPAQADPGFGGDWYDVVELGEGCTAFVVGDVVGHGLSAAARMTEAKATIRSLVLAVDRDEVIPAAGRSLAHLDSGYIATAAIAWVDASADRVTWCSAGHLPPILRAHDGGAALLESPHHPPIGTPTTARPASSCDFPPGSLLVLCTDGLVERRGEAIDVGMERLRALVEALPADISAAAARDEVLRRLHAEASEDDVAIVVVRNA